MAMTGKKVPLRIRQYPMERPGRALVVVNAGATMRIRLRSQREPKIAAAANLAEILGAVVLAEGGELTGMVVGVQPSDRDDLTIGPCYGQLAEGEFRSKINYAASQKTKGAVAYQEIPVPAGTAVYWISDLIDEAQPSWFTWAENVIANGGTVNAVRVSSASELLQTGWMLGNDGSGVIDRMGVSQGQLMAQWEAHATHLRFRLHRIGARFLNIRTDYQHQELVDAFAQSEFFQY